VDGCGVFRGRSATTVVSNAAPAQAAPVRLTYRTLRELAVIAAQSGLSNGDVGKQAGISDQGQISKLLARLARLGPTVNTGEGQVVGGPNAWRLTSRGRALERAIGRESGGAGG
jgi:hypothetical protein